MSFLALGKQLTVAIEKPLKLGSKLLCPRLVLLHSGSVRVPICESDERWLGKFNGKTARVVVRLPCLLSLETVAVPSLAQIEGV